MYSLILITILMLLLTMELMTPGGLQGFIGTLKPLVGKTPDCSSKLYVIDSIFLRCVLVVLTRFCLQMRNKGGWLDQKDKCKGLRRL